MEMEDVRKCEKVEKNQNWDFVTGFHISSLMFTFSRSLSHIFHNVLTTWIT